MLLPLLLSCRVAFAAPQPAWQERLSALQRGLAAAPAQERTSEQLADKDWVKRRLREMVARDQEARNFWIENEPRAVADGQGELFRRQVNDLLMELDRGDTAEIKGMLEVYDWFSPGEFGERAGNDAWLLVQHADLDVAFQKQVLARLQRLYPAGRARPWHFAYLSDRVAMHEGRPQLYGTQGECGPGGWTPREVDDPARLDERRAAMHMPPMAEYVAVATSTCPGR